MKKAITVLGVLVLACTATASQAPARDQFMDLNKLQDKLEFFGATYKIENPSEEQLELIAKYREQFATDVGSRFTEVELREIVDFLATPTGKKYVEQLPEIQMQAMLLGAKLEADLKASRTAKN